MASACTLAAPAPKSISGEVRSGTYLVEPRTLEPTNKTASRTGIELDRVDGGKIAESWVPWDKYGFYKVLGLV